VSDPAEPPELGAHFRDLGKHRVFWPLVVLALMLLFNLVTNARFFSVTVRDGHLYGSLIDVLNRAAPLMIVSMGLTLVIATRGIDISVGSVVAITGAMTAMLIGGKYVMGRDDITAHPLGQCILAGLGIALLFGMWNGFLVAWVGLQPIIATLILMVAGRGVAQLITEGQIITIYYRPYSFIGNGFFLGVPVSYSIVLALLTLFLLLTRKTALGLFIESIGVNPVAARFAGVRARLIVFSVYAMTSVCAGVAGIIIASNVKSADGNNAGLDLELDAILAVVLGGTSLNGGRFTLVGSVLGALIIQTLTTTIYSVGVPPEVTLVVKATVVFLVSILQSDRVRALLAARRFFGQAVR
jgi:ribose/xylose/arabinose/galactoside ABC-type transport system permease subunit